jgi:hypothetical protein
MLLDLLRRVEFFCIMRQSKFAHFLNFVSVITRKRKTSDVYSIVILHLYCV